MNLEEKQIDQKYIYEGRIINLRFDNVLLPNDKTATREVIEHPGGVCVAALTDKNELLFVNQYRYPYGEVLLEIPAGKLERGEDPLLCGKRELLEETGAVAEQYKSIGLLYPSPGYVDEIIHMYFARVTKFENSRPDEDEFLEVIRLPLEKAVDMVLSGEIRDSKTQTAVLKVDAMLKNGIYLR